MYTYGDPGEQAYAWVVQSIEAMVNWLKLSYVESMVYPGATDKGSAARDSAFLERARKLGEKLVA